LPENQFTVADDEGQVHPRRHRLPKTQRAQCLWTGAPSLRHEKQLRALHIRLRNATPAAQWADTRSGE